jgi:hypothetical protein
MVDGVNVALAHALPTAAQKMKLYLLNPSTRGILFKPIKSNIVEAHGQIAQLLEAEYTPEDLLAVQLMDTPALTATLDAIC